MHTLLRIGYIGIIAALCINVHTILRIPKKFADSLLKIADKMFWAPIAYFGVSVYQNKALDLWGIVYLTIFFVLAVCLRHQGLKVYDLHYEKKKAKEEKARLTNKK